MAETMRLDKFLSNMGWGSRKEVKQLIKDKQVKWEAQIITNPDFVVDTAIHRIFVKGMEVGYQKHVYILLNKPAGVVSATEDNRDQTVIDLLDHPRKHQLFPVGRLDKDTEGLLLLTDDGELSHQLLSPKKHVQKTYYAKIDGKVTQEDVKRFKEGIVLEDGYTCLPGELVIIQATPSASEIHLTITEGKFHQVKRMFEATGKSVTYLQRIRFADLVLPDDLPLGEWFEIQKGEIVHE